MSSLQERAAAAFGALVGKRLTLTKSSGNLRAFHFGDVRRTENTVQAEYALHVSCPWRMERDGRILTGSGDYYSRADDNEDPAWEYGMPWGTVQQQALQKFGTVDEQTGVFFNDDGQFMHAKLWTAYTKEAIEGCQLRSDAVPLIVRKLKSERRVVDGDCLVPTPESPN